MNEFLLEAETISNEFEHFLNSSFDQQDIKTLTFLFDRSQKALKKLKVSTFLIDSLTNRLKEEFNENLGVKITGAGGGGCLLLVHNELVTEEHLIRLLSNFDVKLYYNVKIN